VGPHKKKESKEKKNVPNLLSNYHQKRCHRQHKQERAGRTAFDLTKGLKKQPQSQHSKGYKRREKTEKKGNNSRRGLRSLWQLRDDRWPREEVGNAETRKHPRKKNKVKARTKYDRREELGGANGSVRLYHHVTARVQK